ncbi:MAG: hypothetical protein AB7P20_01415, partial [Rhizobiaceae bacterium]
DNALIKALARAYRWRALIENGDYATIPDLAKADDVNDSYACRLLRLTLLAPQIVKTILDGTQPSGVTVATLLKRFPSDWDKQRLFLGLATPSELQYPELEAGSHGHRLL